MGAVRISRKEVNAINGGIMRDLVGIERLRYNEANRLEMGKKIEELKIKWK